MDVYYWFQILINMDKKESKGEDNKQRIQKLLASKQLIIPNSGDHNSVKCYKLDSFISKEMGENSLVGGLCGAIVVRKDENKKELILHIIMVYDGAKVINVSGNKFTAFMRDFELVRMLERILESWLLDFHLHEQFQRHRSRNFHECLGTEDRETGNKHEFGGESDESNCISFWKNMMEMVLNRQMGIDRTEVRVGVVKDHIRVPDSIMKVYEK